ncbi:NADAR family protein [Clostridium sp. DJ247]|uniref:NADAR family protein n=1 Tax=Clostridium sp. DJ247 TaxID=2726188 RepID=UPI00162562A1|nr:NADAR family protein [Clostridium sp. DJ247]MBC2579123.1 NADAR family protein [Clostridium sp. DJ247]
MKEVFSINNPMAPLWLMFPHFSRHSVGWKMGSGEKYIYEFNDWYGNLTAEEKKQFQELFPEPMGWLGFYDEDKDKDIYDNNILLWNRDGEMILSINNLKEDYKNGKNLEYQFFSGYQPSKDGSITKSCLSQWWKSDIRIDSNSYSCMEQYMMAEKARLFNDDEALAKIMKSTNQMIMQELGGAVNNFDEKLWVKRRYSIILNGSYAKFVQKDELRQFIIGTKDRVLVYDSAYDKIWGICMNDFEKKENPFTWEGENLLGFALMEVREEILRVYKNYDKVDFVMLNELLG